MQVTVHTESIREAISKVLPVTDKKNSRPILTYIMVHVGEGKIEFSATDLDISSKISIEAQIGNPGSFCVNAKNLSDVLRELPSQLIQLKIENSENTLKIHCGDIHFTLLIHSDDDFPTLTFGNENQQFNLTSKQVLEIIQMTSHAIGSDETRLYLNGIYLQEIDSKLRAVATDGHRLSLVDFEVQDNKIENLINGIIVPKKGVFELKRVAESDINGTISISVDDSFLYVNLNNNYKLSIRLIARDYPKYQAVIPSKTSYTMRADRNALFDAIRRIKIMSNEKSNGVRVKLDAKEMTIMANHPSLGDALETIPIDYEGKEMEIGFNAKYLIDTLSTVSEGDISLELNNELSPIVVKSIDTPNYLGIIMPLKL